MSIKLYKEKIPIIDTAQMIEVDRLMIEDYHIELIQMMENAGRCLAILTRDRFLEGNPKGKKVMVLSGTGGNGGGALVAARRLHNWGAQVTVFMTSDPERMKPVSLHQYRILQCMGVAIQSGEELPSTVRADVIIDGIIGYSINGAPKGLAKAMIEWINKQGAPVLSLDTPSGIDLTSGQVHQPSVKANGTLTLALPKKGLYQDNVLPYRGELYLGDISVPNELYASGLSIHMNPIFAASDVLRID